MERLRRRGFASQYGQDVLLDAIFRGLGVQRGIFVDVGAHDGTMGSNTLFFEQERSWTGICIEPLPEPFVRLRTSRTARCFNCAVGDTEGEAEFVVVRSRPEIEMLSGVASQYDARHRWRIDLELSRHGGTASLITVPVRRLDEILDDCEIHRVDFLSVDVEGSELAVLRSLDFARTAVMALAVENNYEDESISRYLAECSDLRRIFRVGVDDIYLNLRAMRGVLSR
jgi:FkbM family methyltransferase